MLLKKRFYFLWRIINYGLTIKTIWGAIIVQDGFVQLDFSIL